MMIDDRSGSKDEQDSIEQDHEPETTAPKEQDNIIERGPVKRVILCNCLNIRLIAYKNLAK